MWVQLSLFLKKLKNRFSKIPLKWNCSNQQINTKSFHYIYRWTYHENLIALVQKTVEVYYYPLRPLKWAKTQKLAPTGHFKGYDPTFWAKRHTMTLDMIPKGWIQDQIPTPESSLSDSRNTTSVGELCRVQLLFAKNSRNWIGYDSYNMS